MKIGILADIHAHLDNLQAALAGLQAAGIDRIVVLGDLIESPRHAAETISLLKAQYAVGVWGNHELGLCVEPRPEVCALYPAWVVDYFSTLAARFELGELLFSHSLPSQDAADPAAYYLGPRPHEPGALDASFAQFRHRIMFIGHFHDWFAATPNGCLPWDGSEPLRCDPDQRYFVVVHAVADGWFAIFDDVTNVLTPIVIPG